MFGAIVNGARKVSRYYKSTPALNSIGNAFGGYFIIKFVGTGAAFFSGNREVDDLAHFIAPVFSGGYLLHRSTEIRNDFARGGIQALVVGAVGADLARLVSEYDQGIYHVHRIRDYTSVLSDKIGNATMVRSPEAQAFWTGAIGTGLYKAKNCF